MQPGIPKEKAGVLSTLSLPSAYSAIQVMKQQCGICVFVPVCAGMENHVFKDLNSSKYTKSARISQKQKGPLKLPRKRWLDDPEYDLKKMSVRD